jgi:hypothetical protein
MKSLIAYLGCGNVELFIGDLYVNFVTSRLSDIGEKIIPFFHKYQIEGVKGQDFADFCKVYELMKVRAHLSPDGMEQIRVIKASMNKGRTGFCY